MTSDPKSISRRRFLNRLAAVGGAGAVYHGLTTLGLLSVPPAYAGVPAYPAAVGAGRKVVIIGAGVAGLASALQLSRAGFHVQVIEANGHIGGRSLTVRKGDTYAEVGGEVMTCEFDEGLYLNVGPGRIPHHHTAIIDYCREIGVEMEPFIFATRANLLQSDRAFEGRPIQLRRIKHDLRGQLAEMLAKVDDPAKLESSLTSSDRGRFLEMLSQFGDLQKDGSSYVYRGSDRAGFAIPPGGGRNPGTFWPQIEMKEILDSDFWNNGLFNDMRHYWQASLMQPRGGMDMIVKRFLAQPVPANGTGTTETLFDKVTTNAPVLDVMNTGNGVRVVHDTKGEGSKVVEADFCISTMAPSLLAKVKSNFSRGFANALSRVGDVASCKVGWQASERFWEQNDSIYGGISWIDHPISQIWYPSDGFFSSTGTLTGAYNRGPEAEAFGKLSHAERVALALDGGEKLHPGFSNWVYRDRALSIAWQNMPYFAGGWQAYTFELDPDAYRRLTMPEGNVYLAGDFLSYMPGWKEGAVRSADLAVGGIVSRVGQLGATAQ